MRELEAELGLPPSSNTPPSFGTEVLGEFASLMTVTVKFLPRARSRNAQDDLCRAVRSRSLDHAPSWLRQLRWCSL